VGYGCKIWDEYGNTILDTTDYTARLVYSDVKSGNSEGSMYIPEADGTMPFVLTYPGPNYPDPTADIYMLLVVSIAPSGTLTWRPIRNSSGTSICYETGILVYVCDEKVS